MIIKSCKSFELSDQDIEQIYNLYDIVFHEKRDSNFFKEQYLNTALGYSFHAVAEEDGKIVGHNVYVPFFYYKNNERFLLALSIDAMVHPDFQGQGIYSKLLYACEELAKKEGCKIRIGFPNENSYPIQTKAFKYHDFGTLDIYFLPHRLSKLNSLLLPIEWLSRVVNKIKYSKNFSRVDFEPVIFPIRRDRKSFDKYRFNWFGGNYQIVEKEKCTFVYRAAKFKGISALFLMDVYPLSKQNFDLATKYLFERERDYPFIIYVGHLPFKPSMYKIPKKVEPKHFHFVGVALDEKFNNKEILDINNWELNLSSYDLL